MFELGDGEEYIVEGIESVNNGTYVLSGNRGTITVSSAANAKMSIHVTLTTAEGATLSYDADDININVTTNLDNSEAMSNLCRTWIVLGIVIDIKGDVNAFREFEGGNLYEMALYANEQGAGLTADELQELNGTTVVNTIALMNGAAILRVHDVKEAVQAVKIITNY